MFCCVVFVLAKVLELFSDPGQNKQVNSYLSACLSLFLCHKLKTNKQIITNMKGCKLLGPPNHQIMLAQNSWLRDVPKVTHLTAQEAWTAADDRDGSTADYAF